MRKLQAQTVETMEPRTGELEPQSKVSDFSSFHRTIEKNVYVTWRQDGFLGLMGQVVRGLGSSGVKVPAQVNLGTGLRLYCFDPYSVLCKKKSS